MACDNCSEELITTSQGPQGEQGVQGEPGTNGTNGVLDWGDFDLSCWIAEGITEADATNDEISQDMIDALCEVYQAVHRTPVAVNDYRTIDQGTTSYIQVIDNDIYYPDVTVTIAVAPSNGTATVEPDNKTIKYIPDSTFVGIEDFDYTINDGVNTSTATIKVTVTAVISQQTIQDTVLEQLQVLLQSDDYWDLAFKIGDKIIISDNSLSDFNFTNVFTAGIGKPGRYSKWAICNGNNGTDAWSGRSLRGYDHLNVDYDRLTLAGKEGGSDSLSFTLSKENIPPHRHKSLGVYIDYSSQSASLTSNNATILKNAALSELDGALAEVTTIQTLDGGGWSGSDFDDAGAGSMPRIFTSNTGDGTDNVGGTQGALKPTPDAITKDIRNSYSTAIIIQKIA